MLSKAGGVEALETGVCGEWWASGQQQGEQAGTTHFLRSDRDTGTNQGTVTTVAHTSGREHPTTDAGAAPPLGLGTEVGGDILASTEGL